VFRKLTIAKVVFFFYHIFFDADLDLSLILLVIKRLKKCLPVYRTSERILLKDVHVCVRFIGKVVGFLPNIEKELN
jgi:hypothetical protein